MPLCEKCGHLVGEGSECKMSHDSLTEETSDAEPIRKRNKKNKDDDDTD